MTSKLCIFCCENFRRELEAAVGAEGFDDVTVAAFPSRCGRPPLSWEALRPPEGSSNVVVLGRACLARLGQPPAGGPPARQAKLEECFHVVAGATLVSEAIARGAYLLTPGWLEDWPQELKAMGFDEDGAREFFQGCAAELVLLDTGVSAEAPQKLAELSRALGLPATRLFVGLDWVRSSIARLVAEWRLELAREEARQREQRHARELADHKAAMDFLARLPVLNDERETLKAIEELFHMLFAPRVFHYVRFEGGTALPDEALPLELSRQVEALEGDWAWTTSEEGFLLRIARAGETLGVVVVERFELPEYAKSYLSLALSIAGVAALGIDNARTYWRIKETEEALRKSEQSLKMAQAMAHLGHWELEAPSGIVRWSDETYRILGYEPRAVVPSYDALIQAIHSDDRARVTSRLSEARDGASVDLEFKVVLPDGRVRVLYGVAEGHAFVPESSPAGTAVPELLGVIQDITEYKELEGRLEKEAHTDPLTGCANRRFYLELAEREVVRARRHPQDVSVLMLDLDHFKAFNDRHGHQVGDRVLQALVRTCQGILREGDTIGRLGGEEFAILLPETGWKRARDVADRLCLSIAAVEVPIEGGAPLHFTASIGVATLRPDDPSISTVLGRADQALYEAKSAGRNRVVVA